MNHQEVNLHVRNACHQDKPSELDLDSILKSRDIILPTKVCIVKAMVFPIVMYGSESWTIKKLIAENLTLLNCGAGGGS